MIVALLHLDISGSYMKMNDIHSFPSYKQRKFIEKSNQK